MPGNPEQCRIYADMCRLLAGNSPDEAWREHFTELTLNWERLAADKESAATRIESTSNRAISGSASASRRDSRRSRALSSGQASRLRHIAPAADRSCLWSLP